jgi:hypothetical protein
MLGGQKIEAYSAGSRPSEYDLTQHRSKSLDELPPGEFDAAITMGCGDDLTA